MVRGAGREIEERRKVGKIERKKPVYITWLTIKTR